jgi:hypothetical protein
MPTGIRARAVFRELGSVVYRNNLGIAYNELPTGDRAANLQKAKVCLESADDRLDAHLILANVAYEDISHYAAPRLLDSVLGLL